MGKVLHVEPKAILLSTAVILLVEIIVKLLHFRYLQDRPSKEELSLCSKIQQLQREAELNNFPSTFMTWARLSRQASRLEAKLEEIKLQRKASMHNGWKTLLTQSLKGRVAVLVLLLHATGLFDLWSTSVEFAAYWLWPFASLVSYPLNSGNISMLAWVLLSQRVITNVLK